MDLCELMTGLGVKAIGGPAPTPGGVRICDITEDSRTVVPGSLFIARAGLKADGKVYTHSAAQAGAAAILTDDAGLASPPGFGLPVLHTDEIARVTGVVAERFYGNASRLLSLAGVTGTNGKSTTTYLIWQLLNRARIRCGMSGTVVVDDGSEVAPASMTTPPAIELSRSLAMMAEAGCKAAALEVSSHALDQKRADALRFTVGVFTNLTGDHLDYHITMESYAAAKARLFELLPEGATAIVNADDPAADRMVRGCRARVLRCSLNAGPREADPSGPDECRAGVLDAGMSGMSLAMEGPWGTIEAQVPLIGRYNAMNVLQAVASCHAMGLGVDAICQSLPKLKAPPGRLEKISDHRDAITVFVDYAHSDDSLRNCLSSVSAVMPGRTHGGALLRDAAGAPIPAGSSGRAEGPPAGRLWVVFGCGGDKDATKRPRMGLAAAELADLVVVTSDNPRTEKPGAIVDQILAGIPPSLRGKVSVQIDRARAIRYVLEHAAPGDVVVIAGKGHETEQILPDGSGGTIKVHFDDREVARTLLDELLPPAAPRPSGFAPMQHHRGRKDASPRTPRHK